MNTVKRQIIAIDEEKCDGCGQCIPSCAEGALQIVEGKARLVKDAYCDGLGNCLGECPQGAISMIEREAEPFDEEAVTEYLKTQEEKAAEPVLCSGCPGSSELDLRAAKSVQAGAKEETSSCLCGELEAELTHWPVQLHLVAPQARFLQGSDLLVAADCVPFACADFHPRLLAGRVVLVGCPKLDDTTAYKKKLVEIFKHNQPKSVTVAHMEVACCRGLAQLVSEALKEARLPLKLQEAVIGVDGSIDTNL